jgi:RND superfamily putative drug exporter
MATFLYRLGKASFRHAKTVLAVWLLALIGIGGAGVFFGGQLQEEFRIPGSESQEAFDRLEAVFPTFAGASAQAVLVAPEGQRLDSTENKTLIARLTNSFKASPGIDRATSPFDEFAGNAITDDARFAYISLQYEMSSEQVTDDMLAKLVAKAELLDNSPIRIEFGGPVFQDQEVGLTITEVFGLVFAALVLIIAFRSLRPSWMPLVSAIIGVGIAVGILLLIGRVVTVSTSAPLLAVMLGLAVGIDYSLFILSRHRTQLAAGDDIEASAAKAVGTAGNAVVFAGVTVIIALLGLYLVGIPFLSVMGLGAAIAVLIAIVAAITLLPAFLALAGESLRPQPGSQAAKIAALSPEHPSMGRRWVRLVAKRPVVFALIAALGLGGLALPALDLDLNLPGGGQQPVDSTQRKAYDLISEGFGPGYNGPLLISVDITGTNDVMDALDAIRDELALIDGVDWVSDGFPSPALDTGIIQVVPTTAPDSIETKQLVQRIRDDAPRIADIYGTPLAVTGYTAIGVDVSQRIQSALVPFGIVVVGLSIVLLLMVFRSILVPLTAAIGFLLSVTAGFGVVVAIFQWGYGADLLHVTPGPILSFMPIILMAVLFGLAMDYQVFLVSGMREQYVHTGNWRVGVEEGFSQGARVVTAAALIMFFVFFAFVPEGSDIMKPIALGLAAGIAFDAFIVRMMLIPALMVLFKKSAWWLPSALDRAVPHADVEGEALQHNLTAQQWASKSAHLALHGDYLVVGDHGDAHEPVSFEVAAGARANLVAAPQAASSFAAAISGYVAPQSGALHVMGHALPSEAAPVRKLVSVWSRTDEDALTPLGESLRTRLSWSPFVETLSKRELERQVETLIQGINSVIATLDAQNAGTQLHRASLPGIAPRAHQIVIWAALATASRAPVCLVSPVEPVSDDDERALWWHAMEHFASAQQTIVLCSTPPARALTPREAAVTIDLSVSHGAEVAR